MPSNPSATAGAGLGRLALTDPQRRIPFSPLVLTPAELEQRLALGDAFYQEIVRRGRVLYAHS